MIASTGLALVVLVLTGLALWSRRLLRDADAESHILTRQSLRLAQTVGEYITAVNAIPTPMALLAHDGTIATANRAWRELAAPRGDTVPPLPDLGAVLPAYQAGDTPRGTAVVLDLPVLIDGRERICHLEVLPIATDGDSAAAVATLHDRSEQTHLRETLRRQTEILDTIAASTPGIAYQFVSRPDGEISYTYISPQLERLLGYEVAVFLVDTGSPFRRITHPDDMDGLIRSMDTFLVSSHHGDEWRNESRVFSAAGETRWIQTVARLSVGDNGTRIVDGMMFDVSERHIAAARIMELEDRDPTTGFYNRAYLMRQLKLDLADAQRWGLALLVIGLDEYPDVVSGYGIVAADQLLQELRTRVSGLVRRNDPVAYLDGGRVGLFVNGIDTAERARRLGLDLALGTGGQYLLQGHTVEGTARIGIAYAHDGARTAEELYREAMVAFDRTQRTPAAQVALFNEEMTQASGLRVQMRSALSAALTHREMTVHYQPRIDLRLGSVAGCEALLRWNHPALGLQLPGRFIGFAEQSGLIVELDRWVLRETARQAREWLRLGLPSMVVSANLSPLQLQRDDLVDVVRQIVEEAGLPANSLQLEITESAFFGIDEVLVGRLAAIRDLGVLLAIDDFGTGYSSLAYLRQLPVDTVKIDRRFVVEAPHSPSDAEIVRSVMAIARSLRLNVVAEGVETVEQLTLLREMGLDEAQGFLLGRPLEANRFAEFCRNFRFSEHIPGREGHPQHPQHLQ